ncbi:hypothetical protein GCM10009835_28430 [Planosporangium flavigriseum]|uniref:Uncharacterized protein n=1 Tax=Planosporangium flavigriseum TaxID=373681 RepID=A0A8J3LZE0_9ACTN|nr:hypothetical protein Pfl04_46850 [Planosporangium flavigriseum]
MEEVAPDVRVRRAMALRRAASAHYGRAGSLAGVNLHSPLRPSWTCTGCSAPWPCQTRRGQLLASFDSTPVSLTLLMGGYFIDAAQDLHAESASALYQRFMGWLKQ